MIQDNNEKLTEKKAIYYDDDGNAFDSLGNPILDKPCPKFIRIYRLLLSVFMFCTILIMLFGLSIFIFPLSLLLGFLFLTVPCAYLALFLFTNNLKNNFSQTKQKITILIFSLSLLIFILSVIQPPLAYRILTPKLGDVAYDSMIVWVFNFPVIALSVFNLIASVIFCIQIKLFSKK